MGLLIVILIAILYLALGYFIGGLFGLDDDDIAMFSLFWPALLLIGFYFALFTLGSRINKKICKIFKGEKKC